MGTFPLTFDVAGQIVFWKARREAGLRTSLDDFFFRSIAPSLAWPLELPSGHSYDQDSLALEAQHFGICAWELAIAIHTGKARVVGEDDVGPIIYLELLNTKEEAERMNEIPVTGSPQFG